MSTKFLIFCLCYYVYVNALNIALHAQLHPSSGKIVGSVITTEGMKQAFLKRSYQSHEITCSIFYPFHYPGFYNTKWDLILIEGWFPTIHDFIRLARLASPDVIILFFCLDPVYPGLEIVLKFDVDGYLTNSKKVENILSQRLPTRFVMLAADPDIMKPMKVSSFENNENNEIVQNEIQNSHNMSRNTINDTTNATTTNNNNKTDNNNNNTDDSKETINDSSTTSTNDNKNEKNSKTHNKNIKNDQKIDVVYVGAGGEMIQYKKHLLMMLQAASRFNLHIYGSKWDEVPSVKHAWRGILPQNELSTIYASAKVVIASTIDSQSEYDMLNNR